MAYIIVYQDARREWRWTLRANNHRTVADSAEGYETLNGVEQAVEWVKVNFPAAPVSRA